VTAMRAEVASVTAMRDEMASWMDTTRREVSSLAEQVTQSIGARSPGRQSTRESAPPAGSIAEPPSLRPRGHSVSQTVLSQVGPPVRVAATRTSTELGGHTTTTVRRRRITVQSQLQWPVWRDNGSPWEKLEYIDQCEAIGRALGWDSDEMYSQFYLANTSFALRLKQLDDKVDLVCWEQARTRILALMGRGLPGFLRRSLLHPRGRSQETTCQFFRRIHRQYLLASKHVEHLPTEHEVIDACMGADSFTEAMWTALLTLPQPYNFKAVITLFSREPAERRRTLLGSTGSDKVFSGAVMARVVASRGGVYGAGSGPIAVVVPWCIAATVDNEPVRVMVDSGASVSMLASAFGRRHRFRLEPPLVVYGVHSAERGYAHGAKVSVRLSSSKTVTHRVVLTDEELPYAVDMVMGQDLIRRAGLTLTCDGVLLDDERIPQVSVHDAWAAARRTQENRLEADQKRRTIVSNSRLRRLKRMEVGRDLPRQQGSVPDRVTAVRRYDNTTPNGQGQPDQSDQLGLEDSAGAAAAPAGAGAAADDEAREPR